MSSQPTGMRVVAAIDAVTSGASIAWMISTGGKPATCLTKYERADTMRSRVKEEGKTPLPPVERLAWVRRTAETCVETLLRPGLPDLVMLMKPSVGGPTADQTGPRRMMLVGEIERQLTEAGVPIAECDSMTLAKWTRDVETLFRRPKDYEVTEARCVMWFNPPQAGTHYRMTTVGLAGAAALAVGMPTAHHLTERGRRVLASELALPSGWTFGTGPKADGPSETPDEALLEGSSR